MTIHVREPLQHWGIGKLTVPVDAVLKVIPSNSPHSLTSVGRRVRARRRWQKDPPNGHTLRLSTG